MHSIVVLICISHVLILRMNVCCRCISMETLEYYFVSIAVIDAWSILKNDALGREKFVGNILIIYHTCMNCVKV